MLYPSHVVRFEYLKACGASLKVPNVAPGFQWGAERVRLISQHSSLYVRALYPILSKVSIQYPTI
jgi:hypothetical protein